MVSAHKGSVAIEWLHNVGPAFWHNSLSATVSCYISENCNVVCSCMYKTVLTLYFDAVLFL